MNNRRPKEVLFSRQITTTEYRDRESARNLTQSLAKRLKDNPSEFSLEMGFELAFRIGMLAGASRINEAARGIRLMDAIEPVKHQMFLTQSELSGTVARLEDELGLEPRNGRV